MHLNGVEYQTFHSDIPCLQETETLGWHQLDGQVKLQFSDGQPIFISWGNTPIQYSIEIRSSTFFAPDPLIEVSMAENRFWDSLVGSEVVLEYINATHQVLCVRGKDTSVFLSSQYDDGTFYGDWGKAMGSGLDNLKMGDIL
jgi:hypothetical protein